MHLDRGRIQRDRLDLDAHDLLQLKLLKDAVQHAALRPAVHPGVDGVPVAKTLGQSAPLASMLSHIQQSVQQLQVRQAYIAPLYRQTFLDPCVLLFRDLHSDNLHQLLCSSVNTP